MAVAQQAEAIKINHGPRSVTMPNYFKPLRRKIGVITLGLACVFAITWIRSRLVFDQTEIWIDKSTTLGIISINGTILFMRDHHQNGNNPWSYPVWESGRPLKMESGFESRRFFGTYEENLTSRDSMIVRWIHYYSITIPLTLLSALLLLSKPRLATQKKTTESTTEKIG